MALTEVDHQIQTALSKDVKVCRFHSYTDGLNWLTWQKTTILYFSRSRNAFDSPTAHSINREPAKVWRYFQ